MPAPCVVTTKRLPTTATRPTRYKAVSAFGDTAIVTYDSNGNVEGHRDAFRALCEKMGWATDDVVWAEGFQDQRDQARVFVPVRAGT